MDHYKANNRNKFINNAQNKMKSRVWEDALVMRAKCSKCKNVFEAKLTISLVHIGPLRLMKCPACGKTSMMNTFVNDRITWPPEEITVVEKPLTDEELRKSDLKNQNTKTTSSR